MEYLEGQKVIFWMFPVLVEYAVREKGGAACPAAYRVQVYWIDRTPAAAYPADRHGLPRVVHYNKKKPCNDYQNNQRFQLAGTTRPGGGILPSGEKPENTPSYKYKEKHGHGYPYIIRQPCRVIISKSKR